MFFKDFVYSVRKILNEEIPVLDFRVEELPEDVYRIKVSFPFYDNSFTIGFDNLDPKVEVYIRDKDKYTNLGRFTDPQEVFTKIEEYLNSNYGIELDRLTDLDFFYCLELKDFLEYNRIPVRLIKENRPKLVINFPDNWNVYTIEFSEHNDSVLVEIIKTSPTKDDRFEEEEIYSVEIKDKDPQSVFTSILTFLRREDR